uniref:Enhancer of mRNA-decapping protein 3 n=1 Tax=Culicoides sonorensis TaxID=179676 RepID=A0A336K915_CULSO
MTENFLGKAVSIHCKNGMGIFQGHIKAATPTKITIIRAFRNGIPLKKQDMEITINASDIEKLDLIPTQNTSLSTISMGETQETPERSNHVISKPTPIKKETNGETYSAFASMVGAMARTNIGSGNGNSGFSNPASVNKSPQNGASGKSQSQKNKSKSPTMKYVSDNNKQQKQLNSNNGRTKPIDVPGTNNYKYTKKQQRQQRYNRNSAFGTPVDDSTMDEDFDFEKNLALFDKQAIWDEIENGSTTQKPDLLRETNFIQQQQPKKFRHDENVISSKPPQYRQIVTEYKDSEEYVTDDGLIIPGLPQKLRDRVQNLAEEHGLSWERQSDMLARGATELALLLLGASRRLIPKNQHQWPVITIICDEPFNERIGDIACNTGRQLASHGLKIMLHIKTTTISDRQSKELELFTDTGNDFCYSVDELPQSDLVILAVKKSELSKEITDWILNNRATVLAIDPPIEGVKNVTIKCSLLPILPLAGLNKNACGRLYLCNLGIPLKFYRDSGIKYKSPFGSKFVIPLYEEPTTTATTSSV